MGCVSQNVSGITCKKQKVAKIQIDSRLPHLLHAWWEVIKHRARELLGGGIQGSRVGKEMGNSIGLASCLLFFASKPSYTYQHPSSIWSSSIDIRLHELTTFFKPHVHGYHFPTWIRAQTTFSWVLRNLPPFLSLMGPECISAILCHWAIAKPSFHPNPLRKWSWVSKTRRKVELCH